MTFRQFAFNNVKRNMRAYLSYFLSCMFAVTVFFMFAVVVFHPAIQEKEFRDVVQLGIFVAESIIYGFSFLFVLYSTGAFIKSRKKEYGLLTTLGISKSQLNWMLIIENSIIGIASIVSGLLLGALLTKLFLMIFSEVLGLDEILPFYLSLKAILLTAGLFFIMFELNTLAVVWTLRTKSIMDVFRGSKGPKKTPSFSWLLCLLAFLLIGGGYYLAYTSTILTIFIYMVPIVVLVVLGTYLLFTQFMIAFTNLLRRQKNIYFKNLNLLTVADLTYKLKDNARLLFFVATLSAVSFTASGVLYGIFQGVQYEAERYIPEDVTLISKGEENVDTFQHVTKSIEGSFKKKEIPFQAEITTATQAQIESDDSYWNDTWIQLYSYSDYQKLVELQGESVLFNMTDRNAVVLQPGFLTEYQKLPETLTLASKNRTATFPVTRAVLKLNKNIFTSITMIVSDQQFNQFIDVAESNEIYKRFSINIPHWPDYVDEVNAILNHERAENVFPDSKASFYVGMKESMSYLFFFGIFISVLFFLAAGSILYFRMYQNMDNDLHHYRSLYRIGLTESEMKQIATRQVGFLFFIPFFVAVIHAGFAFKALQNIMASSVLWPSVKIIGLFFVIHLINFIFIRNVYTAKLKKVM